MSKPIALVTGGTRGIGRAISEALSQAGNEVIAIYQNNDEAAKKFTAETGMQTLKLSVTDYEACQAAIQSLEAEGKTVSILVNNAGITRDGVLHKMDPQNWHDVIDTNLTSCFNLSRCVIPSMRANKYGRIINISSINGQKGQFGQTNYAAAKAGMLGFTKSLALENAIKGVTVNAICPGYIETDMTGDMKQETLDAIVSQIPMMRMGQPQEIADIVAFLASDKASYITGATISANGGQYLD